MSMSKETYVKKVKEVADDYCNQLSLEDYIDACDELADDFQARSTAAEFDLENREL